MSFLLVGVEHMNSVNIAAEMGRLLKTGLEYSGKFCQRQNGQRILATNE